MTIREKFGLILILMSIQINISFAQVNISFAGDAVWITTSLVLVIVGIIYFLLGGKD